MRIKDYDPEHEQFMRENESRSSVADRAYQEYLQAEDDGTLLEDSLEDYLALLSKETGIDLAALVDEVTV